MAHPLPEMLEDAIVSIEGRKRSTTPGRILAELSFGFWTTMLSKKHEKSLWVPHLHHAFAPGRGRADIAERMERIRRLRNRIAHHEPILQYDLEARYNEIIECTG